MNVAGLLPVGSEYEMQILLLNDSCGCMRVPAGNFRRRGVCS